MNDLIEKLKSHIHWEEGMDDSLLSFYIEQGQRYVKKACGREVE
ncbi:head-tail connector protein, partial [Bacillus pseudomycoides]